MQKNRRSLFQCLCWMVQSYICAVGK